LGKSKDSQDDKSTSSDKKTVKGPNLRKCRSCVDHVRRDCKQKGYRADSGNPDCDSERISGTVNNKEVTLLMNFGCDVMLVNSKLVLSSDFVTGKTLDIHQMDGSKLHLPLADLCLHYELQDDVLRVGILDSRPDGVLLAVQAIPVAVKILKNPEQTEVCVATRSQVRTQKIAVEADELAQDNVRLSPVERNSVRHWKLILQVVLFLEMVCKPTLILCL